MLKVAKRSLAEIRADDVMRGAWLAPLVLAAYFSYRFFPMPHMAFVNLGGAMAVILLLHAFRLAPLEAVSTGLLVLLAGLAAVLAQDLQLARVMLGGLFLIATVCSVAGWIDSREPFDGALAFGISTELASWFLGNANRGTFGLSVAVSAIGQAYGPMAQPLQWAAIFLAYTAAAFATRYRSQ